jgi:D-glycero-alpha-D-manno-heptose 1-phosphate guanylyltransferase
VSPAKLQLSRETKAQGAAMVATCPALVLAGGLGTRLQKVFTGPKCMAPVGGVPFLEYLLRNLRSCGIGEVVLCVGFKRSRIQHYFRAGSKYGLHIRYSIERQLRGTGGAVANARPILPDDSENVFVLNGDSFCIVDFERMHEFHRKRHALVTIALANAKGSRYGAVVTNSSGAIVAFREKASKEASMSGSRSINGGVYLFNKRLFDMDCMSQPTCSLERDVFPGLVGKGLYGFLTSGYFIDIGVPEDYARVQLELQALQGNRS